MKTLPNYIQLSLVIFIVSLLTSVDMQAQDHSVARKWNEVVLEGIRNDYARPTVHARNLFHTSILMYDAWSVYDTTSTPFFLGKTLGTYDCPFDGAPAQVDIQSAQEEAMSYAVYRMIRHRFATSPGATYILSLADSLLDALGYSSAITSVDYSIGGPAELGNYLAQQMIAFGYQDGANEINGYANQYYDPVNEDLFMAYPGNPDMTDPNRWQPISVTLFIDQGGNPFPFTPPFLSPEWGKVVHFALDDSVRTDYYRDGFNYRVYHDPGAPPYIDTDVQTGLESLYKWAFCLVPVWASHLDPSDGVIWDISPASIGNNPYLPTNFEDYDQFYDFFEGGDISEGHTMNPKTNLPYEPQYVPRGDYARALAEFWADGPDSETPPGHWFTLLNYVNDHPDFQKRWRGKGPVINDLEWDVKAYFVMGGTMHDAAVAAWGVKGWYDYLRPVSAVRYMAELGQSTDTTLSNYHPGGIPLIPGYIEVVEAGDPLAADSVELIGKIKLYTWKGPDYIADPETDEAGVDWILAEHWWPYQRPTFVTPPFAGYVSGHSTYSRAAAELMTLMTGDAYFPGGMGEFHVEQNEFLVFEEGPSMDFDLQWATYRDASDQCSLSRIWGGIHPPVDDIPGRLMGEKIGVNAFHFAERFLDVRDPQVAQLIVSDDTLDYSDVGDQFVVSVVFDEIMDTLYTPVIGLPQDNPSAALNLINEEWVSCDTFNLIYNVVEAPGFFPNVSVSVSGTKDVVGNDQVDFVLDNAVAVDTKAPQVEQINPQVNLINDDEAALGFYSIEVVFDEKMDLIFEPQITFSDDDPTTATLSFDALNSVWLNDSTYIFTYEVFDVDEELSSIEITLSNARDYIGNELYYNQLDFITVDTKNPTVTNFVSSLNLINDDVVGTASLSVEVSFDEPMITVADPLLEFTGVDPQPNTLALNPSSAWLNESTYNFVFDVLDENIELPLIEAVVGQSFDVNGNPPYAISPVELFEVDTKNPQIDIISANTYTVTNSNVGENGFTMIMVYNEVMDTDFQPQIDFPVENPLTDGLVLNLANSDWVNESVYQVSYDVLETVFTLNDIDIAISAGKDLAANNQVFTNEIDYFDILLDSTLTSVFDLDRSLSIQAFPNPVISGNDLIVQTLKSMNNLSAEIIIPDGRRLTPLFSTNTAGNRFSFDTSDLSPGLYLLELRNADNRGVVRFQVIK